MADTRQKTRDKLLPLLETGEIPVITGFIAATKEGVLTTLGRGGSDYTASILGAALDAGEVWIWTDVNGVMTANPNEVPEARTMGEISYSEASELAYYGAKVLHHKNDHARVQTEHPGHDSEQLRTGRHRYTSQRDRGIRLRVVSKPSPPFAMSA